MFKSKDLIFAYTRRKAIEDGELVDATDTAKKVGFVYSVALTRAVWEECVRVPEGQAQDDLGRLWDILWMLGLALKKAPRNVDRVTFQLYVLCGQEHKLITLQAVCGPGDDGEPCVTVMQLDED